MPLSPASEICKALLLERELLKGITKLSALENSKLERLSDITENKDSRREDQFLRRELKRAESLASSRVAEEPGYKIHISLAGCFVEGDATTGCRRLFFTKKVG